MIARRNGHSPNELKNNNMARYYQFVLPQPALGELVAKVLDDLDGYEVNEVVAGLEEIATTSKLSLKGITSDALSIANELKDDDKYLDRQPTDRLIVAMALSDADAELLITEDSWLIGNSVIQDLSKRLKDNGERNCPLNVIGFLK